MEWINSEDKYSSTEIQKAKKVYFFYLSDKLAHSVTCQIRFKIRAMTQTWENFRKKGIIGQLGLFPLFLQIYI